ncbi:TAXI family TRAP transporter solute-binding subunit [Pseudonocardia sp. DR1-2]|uniref:TAXI family TRAP transporter solute-binding subunit n=1 Tax=Pseudonocardia sp. DR1-2 TaxID=2951168 RepID=UPI0020437B2A|nr:TAXI family TRAP transporter solute-binding subunit [Pseudonocardia sp. DR1-2]MCM3849623.1 TAXI family TRAP transporter solute-binding subunit [Pseudonocardia sp. DR1-2]
MAGWSRRDVLRGGGLLAGTLLAGGALTGCATPPPRPPSPFRLATGPEGAVYREIGAALARLLDREWGREVVEVVHTDSAPENVALLTSGRAELAFVNVDVALAHPEPVVALARVFDSVLHALVPAASPARDARDLDGLILAGGAPRSGTRFVTERLLEVAGVRATLRSHTQADSVRAFRAGEVDGVLSLTGMPTPAVTELAASGGVRLLDLTVQVEALVARHPLEYVPVVVPATMYPPLAAAPAPAVPTLLAVSPSMDDALAHWLTDQLFVHSGELSRVRLEAGQINPRTGAATTPVPLHPAARRWFRDHKP